MTALVKYEAAIQALAECKAVDEVKAWADKAAAMQAYGRMAKDKTLEIDAAEIRIRAERRLGEMIAAQKSDGGLNAGSRSQLAGKKIGGQAVVTNNRQKQHDGQAVVSEDRQKQIPRLADSGISKDLSSRAQKLAAVPAAEFEAEVGEWRDRVAAEGVRVSAKLQAAGERELKKAAQKKPRRELPVVAPREPDADDQREAIRILTEENDRLNDRVAVAAMEGTDDERRAAAELIADLRKQVAVLTAEKAAMASTRDSLLVENGELKKQVAYWRRKAEKVAA